MSTPEHPTLAAVDLGSNSFRLKIVRVENHQLITLDILREPIRLSAGLDEDSQLDAASQQRALACLARFGERLRGFPANSVRAVGTNALRMAKNSNAFLQHAESALGYPIEIIAGREEARLIYLGVAHSLPQMAGKRLVVDIGGGSTEFIIGQGVQPLKLESLDIGCVNHSLKFFANGKITQSNMQQAELAARDEIRAIKNEFMHTHWDTAFGSSGSARVLSEIFEQSGLANDDASLSNGDITLAGLERLRELLLEAGNVSRLNLPGLKAERAPVLPGGLAIMLTAFRELGITQMQITSGALREGVLYDLLDAAGDARVNHDVDQNPDLRDVTVQQLMQHHAVDALQAARVAHLAQHLAQQFLAHDILDQEIPDQGTLVPKSQDHPTSAPALTAVTCAAKLHEIGLNISYESYHKHSAYILNNADMPGFSKREQAHLSLLTLAHRGGLAKMRGLLNGTDDLALVMALRLAVIFCRSRNDENPPVIHARFSGTKFYFKIDSEWLAQHPLTAATLQAEAKEWQTFGYGMQITQAA